MFNVQRRVSFKNRTYVPDNDFVEFITEAAKVEHEQLHSCFEKLDATLRSFGEDTYEKCKEELKDCYIISASLVMGDKEKYKVTSVEEMLQSGRMVMHNG